MCTVTFIPQDKGRGFVLTSNRDELVVRHALLPQKKIHNEVVTYFPQDPVAGGSWIAMSEKGRVCCLLNGGANNHVKNEYHTRSRGEILLNLVSSSLKPEQFFNKSNLFNVQPFTMIVLDYSGEGIDYFAEIIWDGEDTHIKYPSKSTPQVWSSSTLYDTKAKSVRQTWFNLFIENNEVLDSPNILKFHKSELSGDESLNILMKRDNGIQTVSITQISAKQTKVEMDYHDLLNNELNKVCLDLKNNLMALR